ncbi:hypothetical protein [Bradyrhizobium sp. USDA 4350]
MADLYTIRPSKNGKGWDVIRNAPTMISTELREHEAEALAFALNAQVALIEGKTK